MLVLFLAVMIPLYIASEIMCWALVRREEKKMERWKEEE